MNNMSQIMKQAKAMQDKMAELQKKIEDTEIEGASGGGAVKIVCREQAKDAYEAWWCY